MPPVFKRGTAGNGGATRKLDQDRLDKAADRVHLYLRRYLGREDAKKIWFTGQKIVDLDDRTFFYQKAVEQVEAGLVGDKAGQQQLDRMRAVAMYRWQPVTVRDFVCGEQYLNKRDQMYPAVLDELDEINSGKYVEAVLVGGIGSAKTTTALYTTAYQLYLLSCMRSPHKTFGLDVSSEILFIFQSINARLAKTVDFARFRSMIEGCQYFRDHFPFKRDIESRLVFPGRIEVVPVSGAETAAIGQNIIGGLIDELNYMSVVERSKQSVDKGTFDQAVALYNSIARRRKSRFMEQGKMPGILCLVSSKKYPGQFTDQKEAEARTDPTIYVYDKCVWDVKPPGTFTKGWFEVFVGDLTRKPRVLEAGETLPDADRHLIKSIPVDFREDFRKDIINALREIAGVSTLARHPYFIEVEKVDNCFRRHQSVFTQKSVDFVTTRLGLAKPQFYKPHLPRFAHIDLAKTGDSAGVAVGFVESFLSMRDLKRGTDEGMMPSIRIDGVLEVVPPKNSEILFWKIRESLLMLRTMGLNVRWITFDSFESTDSQQLLRQQGFVTGYQSVDLVPCKPYDYLKSAVYDGRLAMPDHPHLQKELLMLERDTKTGKVDHPPGGSKDCADAVAGVVYGLTMRREIWSMFGIPLTLLPSNVGQVDMLEDKNRRLAADSMHAQQEGVSDIDRTRMRLQG